MPEVVQINKDTYRIEDVKSRFYLLVGDERALLVDSGRTTMNAKDIAEQITNLPVKLLNTHADFDHCGLLPIFDEVLMSEKSRKCLEAEHSGGEGFREKLVMHKPYLRICKTLTYYEPVAPEKITVICGTEEKPRAPLQSAGFFSFGDLNFEIYEGQGGHVPGEIVLVDYQHKIAFTGDLYINLKGQTPEQATYNTYAPVLMLTVDTDPALSKVEREAILHRLGVGEWQIFGGHGMKKEYGVHL